MLLAILGTHPLLSLAELSSVYSESKVRGISDNAALIDSDKIHTLGGTIKLARVLEQAKAQKISGLDLARHIPRGKKITIGLSVYGSDTAARSVGRAALELKQQLRQAGTPVRIVPNKQPALSSAQVLH